MKILMYLEYTQEMQKTLFDRILLQYVVILVSY